MESSKFLIEHIRVGYVPDWLTVLFIGTMLAYIGLKIFYPKYWTRYLQAIVLQQETDRLLKERNINLFQLGLLMNLLAILSIALFIFLAYPDQTHNIHEKDAFLFPFLLAIITALFLFKYLSIQFLAYLFGSKEIGLRLNHAWLIHSKIFGIVLLIWAMMLCYLPENLKVIATIGGWGTLGLMLILNYLRAFQVLYSERISILYGILYLCTLEILPILLLMKLAIV